MTEPSSAPSAPAPAHPNQHQQIGRVKGAMQGAGFLRRGMNVWPPFAFAGVHVDEISEDFRYVRVRLRKSPITSNYFGTQYGGSMFSMTDPFWSIMVVRNLGSDYTVWDKAAEIEFVSPGKTTLITEFRLTDEVLDEIREAAADGSKVLRWFENELLATDGTVVARVRKQVYIRRKRQG